MTKFGLNDIFSSSAIIREKKKKPINYNMTLLVVFMEVDCFEYRTHYTHKLTGFNNQKAIDYIIHLKK